MLTRLSHGAGTGLCACSERQGWDVHHPALMLWKWRPREVAEVHVVTQLIHIEGGWSSGGLCLGPPQA